MPKPSDDLEILKNFSGCVRLLTVDCFYCEAWLMSKKTKYVLKRVLPVACIIGLLQFFFTSVLPRQFEMGIPPAVLITTSSFFSMGNGLVCVFWSISLAKKHDLKYPSDDPANEWPHSKKRFNRRLHGCRFCNSSWRELRAQHDRVNNVGSLLNCRCQWLLTKVLFHNSDRDNGSKE